MSDENACTECGTDNPVWFAPNDLWNRVMGSHIGFLCPVCFIRRAESSGVVPTGWVLTEESDALSSALAAKEAAEESGAQLRKRVLNIGVERDNERVHRQRAQDRAERAEARNRDVEAALTIIRGWAFTVHGGTKSPADVWPGLRAALAAVTPPEPQED